MPAAPGQKVTLHDGTVVDADQVPPGARLKGGTVMPTAAGATVTSRTGPSSRRTRCRCAGPGGRRRHARRGGRDGDAGDGCCVPAADVPPGTALADGGIMPVSNDPEATVTLADGTVVGPRTATPGAKLANGGTNTRRAWGAKVKLADGTICDPDKVPPGAQLANGGVMPAMPAPW